MRIQFNTDKTINGDARHEIHFVSLLADSLHSYHTEITRIEAHISDQNGKKDGFDNMRCMLEARMEGRQPIAVVCKADTVEEAMSGAIGKLKSSLKTITERSQNHHQ